MVAPDQIGDRNADPPQTTQKPGSPKLIVLIVIVVLAAAGAVMWLVRQPDEQATLAPTQPAAEQGPRKVKDQPVMEYANKGQNQLMEDRKSAHGIRGGLDMIVKDGELIKVGDRTVSVKEISDSIQAREGGITEKDLVGADGSRAGAYGIYIVQPGDNIWNIHFKLLKAYLAGKNIVLADESDEPDRSGYSSSIGKVLKFSEKMVYIYNIRDRQLAADIHLIRPLTKIVVYKMDRVFDLLDQLDDRSAGRIRFDGETIWIPAE